MPGGSAVVATHRVHRQMASLQYKGTIVVATDQTLFPWELGENKAAEGEAKVLKRIMRNNSQRSHPHFYQWTHTFLF